MSEVEEFNSWLGKLSHTHKIVIAGNHELSFDPLKIEECREYMTQVGEVADCSKEPFKQLSTSINNFVKID